MCLAIRQAGPHDSASLLGLINAHAAYERGRATLTLERLQAILHAPDPEVSIIVAAKQAELVGYAALTMDFSLWRGHRWAHLDCLFVHEAQRGQSIGRHLFEAAKDMARSCGADRMEWQTPLWNDDAIRFYKARGATGLEKMRLTQALSA